MPRPRKKANRIEAEATRTGQLRAEQKFRLRFLDARYSLKTRAASFLDYMKESIGPVDTLELAAVGAMTVLVHGVIVGSEDFLHRATLPFTAFRWERLASAIGGTVTFGLWRPFADLPTSEEEQAQIEAKFPDWQVWIVSFVLSFLLVRYFGQIIVGLGDLAGGITKLVGFMLPLM